MGMEPSGAIAGRDMLPVEEPVDGIENLLVSERHTFLSEAEEAVVTNTIPWALTRPLAPHRLQMRMAGSILVSLVKELGRSERVSSRQECPRRDGGH